MHQSSLVLALLAATAAGAVPLEVSSGTRTLVDGEVFDYAHVFNDAELIVQGGEVTDLFGPDLEITCGEFPDIEPTGSLSAFDQSAIRLPNADFDALDIVISIYDDAELIVESGIELPGFDLSCNASAHVTGDAPIGFIQMEGDASLTVEDGQYTEIDAFGDNQTITVFGDAVIATLLTVTTAATVDLLGGRIENAVLDGNITVSGDAEIERMSLGSSFQSTGSLDAAGGEITRRLFLQQEAAADLGGVVIGGDASGDPALSIEDNASGTMTAGEVLRHTSLTENGSFTLEGGTVGRIDLDDFSEAELTGGTLRDDGPVIASLDGDAELEISGGAVQGAGRRFELDGDATLVVTAQSFNLDLGCAPELRVRPGSDLLEPAPGGPTLAGLDANWIGSGSAAFDIRTTDAWTGEIILRTGTPSAGPLSIGAGSAVVGPADVYDIAFAAGNATIDITGGAIVDDLPLGPLGDDVQGVSVGAADTARIDLSCGSVARRVDATDDARLDVSGGDFEALYLRDDAIATVRGGDLAAPLPEGRFDLAGNATLRLTTFSLAVDDDLDPATPPTPLAVPEEASLEITAASPFLIPIAGGEILAIPELRITWPDASTTSASLYVDADWTGAVQIFASPPDFDGDGATGSADLGALLAAWGGPGADLDGDGASPARATSASCWRRGEAEGPGVSQIAIELYRPLPGGAEAGGRFAPDAVKVEGLTDYDEE